MATYFKWRKSTVLYTSVETMADKYVLESDTGYYSGVHSSFDAATGKYTLSGSVEHHNDTQFFGSQRYIAQTSNNSNVCIYGQQPVISSLGGSAYQINDTIVQYVKIYTAKANPNAFQGYVYSTNPSAYPNDGVQDGYYYDQLTTVVSPTAPTSLTYPNPITTPAVTVTWNAATSNTDYPVSDYNLIYALNGESLITGKNINVGNVTSYQFTIPDGTTSIQFAIQSRDSNGQLSDYTQSSGPVVPVTLPPSKAPIITVPETATEGLLVTLSWNAVTLATGYKLQRNIGATWVDIYTGADLSFSETVGHWNILKYRVQATNAQGAGPWSTEKTISVRLSPILTIPSQLMQGQTAAVSWSIVAGADSYTLQRKANTDADWTQVYSGTALTFTETVGTWTSVQYRVQAVFSGTPGGWAESAAIPVVSASALVISGTDGDLGTIINDIPYSISTDTGNQITATITVNSAVIFSGNVGNSTSDVIPVLDLVNGEGTIVIEASVTASSGPVSAVRTWTYTKTLITFPNAGSVAQLTKEGENIFPKTLAECVRLPGGKTLDQVMGFPAQVYTGSYVGTGTYGASNPTTLSFPFEPKMVIIAANAYQGGITHPLIRPDTVGYVTIAASIYSTMVVSWAGKEISFYDANSAIRQFNNSGTTYYYIALG